MGYTLIWIELVVLGMLTAALLLAGAGRLRLNWTRWLIGALVVIVPMLAVGGLFTARHSIPFFYDYLLSLWSCMLLGIAVLAIVGLRRSANTGEPTARDWRPGRLALAWALVLGLHMMTLANMDTAVRGALGAATTEAGTIALSTAPPRVPDRQNAALLYAKAFESLREPAAFGKIEGDVEEHFADKIDELRELLADQQIALSTVRRAAAMPDCRFDRDYARPSISMLIPEVQSLRTAARLLGYDTRVKLADGDVSGALENVSAMFRISRHAAADSLLVTHLVSAAIHANAFASLQAVFAHRQLTSDELSALQLDDTLSYRVLLGRALLMEEAFGLSTFSMLPEAVPDESTTRLLSTPAGAYVRVFFIAGEVDRYRQAMARFRDIVRNPYYQGGNAIENMADMPGLFVKLLLPSFKSVSRATARADAKHTLALAALAAAKYRAVNGKLPSELAELTPEFVQTPLVDPFDGNPIRVVLRDGDLVLYSIGPDGKDQHGEEFNDEKETGDLSFRLGSMKSEN